MLNNNFHYELHKIKSDNIGNCVALDITIEGERITTLNIYGPNTDKLSGFLKTILQCIEEFANEQYLICGDLI